MLIAAAVVAVLLIAAAVLYRWWLRRPLPRTRGRLTVDGISAPLTIGRERRGFTHVDADSMADAAYAIGLAHAQDRLWQLELTRRAATGRISEVAGTEGLAADRFIRRVGLHRVAAEEAALLSAEPRAMLEAYCNGINTVIASRRALPLEFQLLKLRPEPWRPQDSIACGKLLSLGLALNWDTEMQRFDLLRAIGAEKAALLDIVYPEANPTILAETARQAGDGGALLAMFREAARWIPAAGGGSNSWVVSGERTTDGKPLLCNDPHLPPSVPSIWYAAHIRAGDDFETTGVTMPGIPFPIIGHNRRCAWGFTNSFADCQDLVIEEFEQPSGSRYRTENGSAESRIVREVIRVRDASDEVEEVIITRHGPVVERFQDAADGVWRGLALQWTSLTPGSASETVLTLQRAHDWESFRAAFAGFDGPSQNAVYADVDGHIGYFLCGRVPKRRRTPSGLPVPGWTGDALWERFLSVDEVPQQLDPPGGVVVTANNRVVGDDFPQHIGSDYMNGYRARRIAELLDSTEQLDADAMRRIQMDVLNLPAQEVIELLRDRTMSDPHAEQWRRRLVAWDAQMRTDQVEPTLYEAFMRRLTENALRPLCGDAWGILGGPDLSHPVFDYPGSIVNRLVPTLLQRWRDGDAAILDGGSWDDVVERSLSGAIDDVQRLSPFSRRRRWGRVHKLPLAHRFAQRRPLNLIFGVGSITVAGATDTVMATGDRPGGSFATTVMAPSWRQVLTPGDWESSTGVLYPGQSGQPGSRHWRDLVGLWQRNRQLPLAWSAAAVERAIGRRRLRLQPRAGGDSARTV